MCEPYVAKVYGIANSRYFFWGGFDVKTALIIKDDKLLCNGLRFDGE